MFCDCSNDGFCPRYRRDMRGRFRDICRGVNVDLGTAAVFREQWRREARPVTSTEPPFRLLLKADHNPGDIVAMTAAVYSLHRAHPGKYTTAVECPYPEIFWCNPDVVYNVRSGLYPTKDTGDSNKDTYNSEWGKAATIQMHYPAIHQSNDRAIHFMQAWCEHLGHALNVSVPLLTNRPHLYFGPGDVPQDDYWLVCSGGKRDFTAKLWGHENYQEVVNLLRGKVQFIQIGAGGDDHYNLDGTLSMVGRTSLRELFELVRRARGVLCGVSLLMHVAAALEKPCIVIAGGREPVAWNAYPKQQYVHTVGALPCTSTQGHIGQSCWRSRVVPLGDDSAWDSNPCERPAGGLPECMRMIDPNVVAGLILCYNKSSTVRS